MDNWVRAHINITGRVQGVCFRLETQRAARKRGVVGWVRNLPDGSVEAVMEGGNFAVESLIHWCRKGPPVSRVEKVAVDWGSFTGEFTAFDVTY